jgi:hypothetical protein
MPRIFDALFGTGRTRDLARTEMLSPGPLHSLSLGIRHLRGDGQRSYYWLSATFEELFRKGPGLPVLPVGDWRVEFADMREVDAAWDWVLEVSRERKLVAGPWLDEQLWCSGGGGLLRPSELEARLADAIATLPGPLESMELDRWADDRSPASGVSLTALFQGRSGAAGSRSAQARLADAADTAENRSVLEAWAAEACQRAGVRLVK